MKIGPLCLQEVLKTRKSLLLLIISMLLEVTLYSIAITAEGCGFGKDRMMGESVLCHGSPRSAADPREPGGLRPDPAGPGHH